MAEQPGRETPPFDRKGLQLFSLSHYAPFLRELAACASVQRVCEIGIEAGGLTQLLLNDLASQEKHYIGIDPTIPETLRGRANERTAFREARSLEVLADVPPCDLYIVDGDHNYATVRAELELIQKTTDSAAIVVLHDVGWPCGGRDMFYEPDRANRAVEEGKGPVPGRDQLETWGIAAEEGIAWATAAEGPGNGIRAAIDGVRMTWGKQPKWMVFPPIFGLGILWDEAAIGEDCAAVLASWGAAVDQLRPLLEDLERNRLELLVTDRWHVAQSSALWKELQASLAHSAQIAGEFQALREDYQALRTEYRKLRDWSQNLQETHEKVLAERDRLRAGQDP
jgi:hypothetical protein